MTATPIKIIDGIVPSTRPEIGRHAAEAMLHAAGVDIGQPALLGRRGYYADSMGVPGKNDRGIYDDALIVVTPTVYATFNANCDPSIGRGLKPGIAVLAAGLWRYKLGTHHPGTPKAYECLVQAGNVAVHRDGAGAEPGLTDSGEFYIHIHRGSYHSTSSEGCQTIYPDQYDAFLSLVKLELQRYHALTIPYLLTERDT
jgi:lysozyme